MNYMMMYKWGIEHGILFKGGKGSGAAGGYQGPSEAELAARRAEDRAENDRLRKQARLEALDDERKRAEADKLSAAAAKAEEDRLLAERESREEMVGDEAAGQAEIDAQAQADIMRTGERYGDESRPAGTREDRTGADRKRKKKKY